MAMLVLYRRADEARQAAMARYVWLALAAGSAVAVVLAFMQRRDSSIPYLGLLFAVFVLARAWFTLARPEVHFDPSKVEVARESKTASPLVVEGLGMVYELPDGGSVGSPQGRDVHAPARPPAHSARTVGLRQDHVAQHPRRLPGPHVG